MDKQVQTQPSTEATLRLLICGSRSFVDRRLLVAKLEKFLAALPAGTRVTVVHGGAEGADRIAGSAARALGCAVECYPADWKQYGMRAGYVRNQVMLESGVDMALAFVDKPLEQSRGTADMVGRCVRAGVRGVVVSARKVRS
jgi:hypothetical protein